MASPTDISVVHTLAQAARLLGVSTRTLRRYASKRYISYLRYPGGTLMFRQSAIDLFLAQCEVIRK